MIVVRRVHCKVQFMNYDFLVIDINTQKDFVEHFGERAIPDCPEIRENIMELVSFSIRNGIQLISTIFTNNHGDFCVPGTNGWDKILDTECERRIKFEYKQAPEDMAKNIDPDYQQFIIEHHTENPAEDEKFSSGLTEIIAATGKNNLLLIGVPLETNVKNLALFLAEKFPEKRLWLLKDAVKGYIDPEATIAELKAKKNISIMSTRNTIKYLSELSF